MANHEKSLLQLLCKYGEIINAVAADLDHRLRVVEATMEAHPDVFRTYDHTRQNMPKRGFAPGLRSQLEALCKEVENLPD